MAIYLRNIVLNDVLPNNVEAIWIELNPLSCKPFHISTWYCPPNSITELLHALQKVKDKDIVVL